MRTMVSHKPFHPYSSHSGLESNHANQFVINHFISRTDTVVCAETINPFIPKTDTVVWGENRGLLATHSQKPFHSYNIHRCLRMTIFHEPQSVINLFIPTTDTVIWLEAIRTSLSLSI